jgi:dTDP-L-rhamnose 4-epimerase
MNRILITGGAGFIGSRLSTGLAARGHRVRVLDNLAPQIHGAIPRGPGIDAMALGDVEFIRGTVEDLAAVATALRDVDCVVHLAAETGTGQSMYEIARYNRVNTLGTANILEVLANDPAHAVQRIVLGSSRSVYGEGAYSCAACADGGARVFPAGRSIERLRAGLWSPTCPKCGAEVSPCPTHEDDPVRPNSIYAATKLAQEDLVRVGCTSLGLGHCIFRFQNVYGEGQSLMNPYTGILSIFSTRIRRGLELGIFEDGMESRDFVHVDDVVAAIISAVIADRAPDSTINVGTGVGTGVLELAQALVTVFGGSSPIRVTGEFRAGDIRHNIADIGRLRRELGVEPRIGLADGLRRFAEWVCSEPLPEDLLERANAELRARNLMG